jgi:hypothetical protein
MKVLIAKEVKDVTNKQAPGLLRVFIADHRTVASLKKLGDIKKNPRFIMAVAEYLGKSEDSFAARFNNHCVSAEYPSYPGILIQDTTKRYQPPLAKEIKVDIFSDDQDIEDVLKKEEAKKAAADLEALTNEGLEKGIEPAVVAEIVEAVKIDELNPIEIAVAANEAEKVPEMIVNEVVA